MQQRHHLGAGQGPLAHALPDQPAHLQPPGLAQPDQPGLGFHCPSKVLAEGCDPLLACELVDGSGQPYGRDLGH